MIPTEKYLHGKISEEIIGCCFDVMNELGAGFLEAVYRNALEIILKEKGLSVQTEVPFKIYFHEKDIGIYKADLIVDKKIIVELKCCKELVGEHQAQLINYLAIAGLKVGLLVNFGQFQVQFKRVYK